MIPDCPTQQQLIEDVQFHLEQLSVLAQAAKNALSDRDEALGAQIDDRIESEFRLKERAMEALRQHRSEHGC